MKKYFLIIVLATLCLLHSHSQSIKPFSFTVKTSYLLYFSEKEVIKDTSSNIFITFDGKTITVTSTVTKEPLSKFEVYYCNSTVNEDGEVVYVFKTKNDNDAHIVIIHNKNKNEYTAKIPILEENGDYFLFLIADSF